MSFTDIMRIILPKITINGIDYESYVNDSISTYAPDLLIVS